MSPYRAPSPFQTSTPGNITLLESSIDLEGIGAHEQAVSSATSGGPSTITPTVQKKSEYILLASKDFCPSATNGVDITAASIKTIRVCRKKLTSWLGKLKATAGKGVSAAIVVPSRAATPALAGSAAAAAVVAVAVPEDDDASSVDPGDGVGGTSSDSVPIQQSKEVRFNQALWGLESMSKSVCIEAYLGPVEDSPEEFIARVDNLFKDLGVEGEGEGDGEGTSECHDYAGARGDLASSFILINVRNDLSGDGRGYLEIQTLDEGHRGDSEVAHCGTSFHST